MGLELAIHHALVYWAWTARRGRGASHLADNRPNAGLGRHTPVGLNLSPTSTADKVSYVCSIAERLIECEISWTCLRNRCSALFPRHLTVTKRATCRSLWPPQCVRPAQVNRPALDGVVGSRPHRPSAALLLCLAKFQVGQPVRTPGLGQTSRVAQDHDVERGVAETAGKKGLEERGLERQRGRTAIAACIVRDIENRPRRAARWIVATNSAVSS